MPPLLARSARRAAWPAHYVRQMHRNVRKVVEAGAAVGVVVEPRSFPEGTKTAADAAAAIGVEVGQIVKSLVFLVDGAPVMALVSGDNQLDEAKLSAACSGGVVGRADADAVRAATGFPIGGVPPLGHELEIHVDEDLLRWTEVWAAAGTWTDVFPIAPDELVRVTGGRVDDLARRR
jgi:prolyl-tRNA editing enzyme YbaK/EbsC (Cys-tRNA(Pro) deacylase)